MFKLIKKLTDINKTGLKKINNKYGLSDYFKAQVYEQILLSFSGTKILQCQCGNLILAHVGMTIARITCPICHPESTPSHIHVDPNLAHRVNEIKTILTSSHTNRKKLINNASGLFPLGSTIDIRLGFAKFMFYYTKIKPRTSRYSRVAGMVHGNK